MSANGLVERTTHAGDTVAAVVLRNHIAGLKRALLTAELALAGLERTAAPGGVPDDMLTALFEERPDIAREIRDHILGRIPALPDRPRIGRRLTLTPVVAVAAWAAADGSTDLAAEALSCHRNTVINRLREFETLTRLRLSRPGDMLDVMLALRAREFLRGVQ